MSASDTASPSRVSHLWNRLRTVAIVLGGIALLYALRDIAQLLLVATLLAYVLNPLVIYLQGRTDRTTATLIVFFGLAAGITVLMAVLIPVAAAQLERIQVNVGAEQMQQLVNTIDRTVSEVLVVFGGETLGLADRLEQYVDQMSSNLIHMAPSLLGVIGNAVLIPFLALFLLRDGPHIKHNVIRLVPNRYFEFALDALHKVDQQLGSYLRGLVMDVLAVCAMASTAFWLLGINSPVLLGIITGLANVIPYIGALLGGTIAAFVTLLGTGSVGQAGAVIATVFVVQIVDEVVVQPLVLSKAVALHPVEVVLAIMIASHFFGILGMVVAVPVASTTKVVITEGMALIQQYRFD